MKETLALIIEDIIIDIPYPISESISQMARFPWRHHASGIELLEVEYAVRHSRFPILRRALCWLQSLTRRNDGDTISDEEREFCRPRSREYTNWRFDMSELDDCAVDDVESSEIITEGNIDRAHALVAACSVESKRRAHGNISSEKPEHFNTSREYAISGLREAW